MGKTPYHQTIQADSRSFLFPDPNSKQVRFHPHHHLNTPSSSNGLILQSYMMQPTQSTLFCFMPFTAPNRLVDNIEPRSPKPSCEADHPSPTDIPALVQVTAYEYESANYGQ
jgi:hypothetical protein